MPLVSTICPQCGATMEVSDDCDIVFCSYCGAKIINQTQKVELSGKVSVGGIANKKSLIATIVTMPLLIIIEYPIFTLWIIFTIIKEKKCQRLNLKYNVAIIDLQKSKFLLSSKQQAYQNWLAIER